jgi:hypothetical protein
MQLCCRRLLLQVPLYRLVVVQAAGQLVAAAEQPAAGGPDDLASETAT